MSDSLLFPALRKIFIIRVAEFLHDVREEMHKVAEDAKKEKVSDESTTATITDFERPELLDGAVVAKRSFGFGITHEHTSGSERA